jgi:hypothetical protein
MIGLDEIAIPIEEPMRLLPLFDLCNLIMSDVLARLVPEETASSTNHNCRAVCQKRFRGENRFRQLLMRRQLSTCTRWLVVYAMAVLATRSAKRAATAPAGGAGARRDHAFWCRNLCSTG